ncbi:DUF6284 family protein [Micromonospora taraxaci]
MQVNTIPVPADADSRDESWPVEAGPSAADLAEIEREWPLIEAELQLLDVQLALLDVKGNPVDWRRLRRAARRVLAAQAFVALARLDEAGRAVAEVA